MIFALYLSLQKSYDSYGTNWHLCHWKSSLLSFSTLCSLKKKSPKKINWHQIQFTKPVWMIHSLIGLIWFLSSNRLNESVWAC